jgi:hypothetical protein
VTPDSGFAAASVNRRLKRNAERVPTVAVCGVPEDAVTDDGVPPAFVRLNKAVLPIPKTDAVTL